MYLIGELRTEVKVISANLQTFSPNKVTLNHFEMHENKEKQKQNEDVKKYKTTHLIFVNNYN